MKKYIYFGEKVDWYDVRVLNEREVRAAAWILLIIALPIFLISCIEKDFFLTKIYVIFFMLDFFIRVLINPKYSPSMILWKIAVSSQKVEYAWAPQKRFAWAIWLILSITMFFSIVVFNSFWPLNVILCFLCIILLFLETSFWICIWCNIYNKLNKEKAKYCPGWVCEIIKKEPIQKIWFFQIIIVILFVIFIVLISKLWIINWNNSASSVYSEACPLTWETNTETKSGTGISNPCPIIHKNYFNK